MTYFVAEELLYSCTESLSRRSVMDLTFVCDLTSLCGGRLVVVFWIRTYTSSLPLLCACVCVEPGLHIIFKLCILLFVLACLHHAAISSSAPRLRCCSCCFLAAAYSWRFLCNNMWPTTSSVSVSLLCCCHLLGHSFITNNLIPRSSSCNRTEQQRLHTKTSL